MNEIPVYLFTGFMDSGKTSLIKDTLFEQGFAKEGKSLVICCEDGDAEFTDEELEKNNVKLVMVDSEADFTEDFLKKVNTEYQPEQVFLEYNGTWQMGTLMDMELPKYLDDRTAACHGRCNDFRYVSCKYAYNDHGTAFFRRCRDLQSL